MFNNSPGFFFVFVNVGVIVAQIIVNIAFGVAFKFKCLEGKVFYLCMCEGIFVRWGWIRV